MDGNDTRDTALGETRAGAYPPAAMLRVAEEWERRGLPNRRDTRLLARLAGIGIWYTENSCSHESPGWVPPFGDGRAVYRGFDVRKLQMVLETGLDVPAGSPFFATGYRSKAWEYPANRRIAAMLVLDQTCTETTYFAEPLTADPATVRDPAMFPAEYVDGDWKIYTRFERARGTCCFLDEQMYGHWIPGDARAALLGVVIGGPYCTVREILSELHLPVELLENPTH